MNFEIDNNFSSEASTEMCIFICICLFVSIDLLLRANYSVSEITASKDMELFTVLIEYWHIASQGDCSCVPNTPILPRSWILELYILYCFSRYSVISLKIARYLKHHSAWSHYHKWLWCGEVKWLEADYPVVQLGL